MTRILLVDDDPSLALCLKEELAGEGYEVELATDGPTGLQSALSGRFELILLDIGLPEMDGFEVCDRLRKHHNMTPVLMVTSRVSERDRDRSFGVGADSYVTKPFNRDHLLSNIRRLLRQ